jgi:integrase/recombinase XerD
MRPSQYVFTEDITEKLLKLESYLKEKKYHKDSIRQIVNYSGIYLQWLTENKLNPEEVTYKIVIEFIHDIQDRYSHNHAKRIVINIKHFHDSLDTNANPVRGVYIRGNRRSIINDIADYRQLQEVYDNFEALDDRNKRNKMMLSLMIHQALTVADLQKLEPAHLRLKEGKIHIPPHQKMNGRILDLEASQMLELQEYLLVVRPSLLTNMTTPKPGTKKGRINPQNYDILFVCESGGSNLKIPILRMFNKIKVHHPKITSTNIIRTTVIAEWLKTIDIRKVQYMAGHRYVSTTERYNVLNLQDLKENLQKYHPLK